MALIRQLRDDCVSSSAPLPETLRRGLVLASLLRNEELKRWIKNEVDGYARKKDIPDYRFVPAHVYGHFVSSFGRQITNVRVPVNGLKMDPHLKEFLREELPLGGGVASLEEMVSSDPDETVVKFSIPTEACMLLPTVYEGYSCAALWHQTHKSVLKQVVESIRNRLLEVVLDLAERFPDIADSEEAVAAVDRGAASAIIHTHIYGDGNVVAAGTNVTQTLHQGLEPRDLEELVRVLQDAGISGHETEELRDAIKTDGPATHGKIGARVAAWIGRTTQKALESGLVAVPGLITEAVSRYYGWK